MTPSTRFDTALDDAWREFRTGLAEALLDIAVRDEIHIRRSRDASDAGALLLSIAVTDADHVRCTLAHHTLTDDQADTLLGDSWQRTHDDMLTLTVDHRRVDAMCAAATWVLRELFDVLHPTFLAPLHDDGASHCTPTSPRREQLSLDRTYAAYPITDSDHLQELLLDTLSTHGDDAFVDADGDVRVQMGTQTISLRVHPTRPVVEFVACVAGVCVDDRTVNEIVLAEGSRWTGVAVHVLDGHVWATQRLVIPVFVAANVVAAVESWRDFLRDGAPAITARIADAAEPIESRRDREPTPDHVERLLDTLTSLTTVGAPLPADGVARLCDHSVVVARRCLITGARRLLAIGSAKRVAADAGDADTASALDADRQVCRTMLMSVSGAVDLLRGRDPRASAGRSEGADGVIH